MRVAFTTEIHNVMLLLQDQQVHEAQRKMSLLLPQSPLENRMAGHIQAKILMHQNRLKEAIEVLARTKDSFGSHIGILSDLATCFYLTRNLLEWTRLTSEIKQTIETSAEELSVQSLVRSTLLVGKFLEEQAQIAQAIEAFTKCLTHLQSLSETERTTEEFQASYILVLTQLLRVKALYGDLVELGDLYQQIASIEEDLMLSGVGFETQHSLLLAEIALVGVAAAEARYARLLTSAQLYEEDLRLLFFDFLEAHLRSNLSKQVSQENTSERNNIIPAILTNKKTSSKNLDLYETGLYNIAFSRNWVPDMDFVHQLVKEAPLASSIRLLHIMGLQLADTELGAQLKRKSLLLLGGLDTKSRAIWHQFLNAKLTSSQLCLRVSTDTMQIQCDTQHVSLGRKRVMLQLLRLLSQKSQFELSVVCRELWQAEYNPSYYQRVRVLVIRLNQILFELTGMPKTIHVDTQKVQLSENVSIEVG